MRVLNSKYVTLKDARMPLLVLLGFCILNCTAQISTPEKANISKCGSKFHTIG